MPKKHPMKRSHGGARPGSGRPPIFKGGSVSITFEAPRQLRDKLAAEAASRGISLAQTIRNRLGEP